MRRLRSLLLLLICSLAAAQDFPAAREQFRAGHFDLAIKSLRTIHTADARALLVRAYLKQQELPDAEKSLNEALAAYPSSASVHAAAGDLYFRKARFDQAEAEYRKSSDLDPKLARGWWGRSRVAHINSNALTSAQHLVRAHELDPNDPDIALAWAGVQPTRKDAIAALEHYLTLAEGEDPDTIDNVRSYIDVLNFLADRPQNQLISPYETQKLKLESIRVGPMSSDASRGWSVPVGVNGRKPLPFLLDTGAGGILIGSKLAEKFGVQRITSGHLSGAGDQGKLTGYMGFAERVQIGPLELRNVIVRVSDKSNPIVDSGVIGTDVLSDFLITLDFPHRLLSLDPMPAYNPPLPSGFHDRTTPAGWESATPVYAIGHFLLLPVGVNDSSPALFQLDTGSTINLVSIEAARAIRGRRDVAHIAGFSGTARESYTAHNVSLNFAGFRLPGNDITSFDASKISKSLDTELSGMLGQPLLNTMKLAIDYRDGLVQITAR